jgi:arylsulfatase
VQKETVRPTDSTLPAITLQVEEVVDKHRFALLQVDDSYKLPFRFTGTINKLTYNLGKEQMTAEQRATAQKALASARD